MTDAELVEAMARAICIAHGYDWDRSDCPRDEYRSMARDALSVARPEIERRLLESMETASEGMIEAGWIDKEDVSPDEIWFAMLAAFRRERGATNGDKT